MKTYIFDLDDTLVQSMFVWETVIDEIFDRLGIETSFQAHKEHFIKMTASEVCVYIAETYPIEQTPDQLYTDLMQRVNVHYAQDVKLTEGVIPFFEQCKKEGIQMAVMTSNNEKTAQIVLNKYHLVPYLSALFSMDSMNTSKRDPDMFKYVLDTLHATPQETTVFEDSMYAIENATSMGMHCIGMVNDFNRKDFKEHHIPIIKDFRELLKEKA